MGINLQEEIFRIAYSTKTSYLDWSGNGSALSTIMKEMLNSILIIVIYLKQRRTLPDEPY